jgi:hypothetical protein
VDADNSPAAAHGAATKALARPPTDVNAQQSINERQAARTIPMVHRFRWKKSARH